MTGWPGCTNSSTTKIKEPRAALRLGTLSELITASLEAPSPFVPTEHPDVAVLVEAGGQRLRAVPMDCPHLGLKLTQAGRVTSDGTAIECRHRGYAWAVVDGRPLSCGHRGPTGALTFLPTHIDDDGVVWTAPTDEEARS